MYKLNLDYVCSNEYISLGTNSFYILNADYFLVISYRYPQFLNNVL